MMQVLGQGLEDALERQNDDDADILKALQCFFFQIYEQKSWQMTSSKTLVTSSLWFKQFLVWNQKPNSHSQFESSKQNTSFFQNLKMWQWHHQKWRHQFWNKSVYTALEN